MRGQNTRGSDRRRGNKGAEKERDGQEFSISFGEASQGNWTPISRERVGEAKKIKEKFQGEIRIFCVHTLFEHFLRIFFGLLGKQRQSLEERHIHNPAPPTTLD